MNSPATESTSAAVSDQQALSYLMNAVTALTSAYKAANTMDAKDTIFGSMEVIQGEVTALSQKILTDNDAEYAVLTADFKNSTAALTSLQQNINQYVSFISTASSVVNALAQVIPLIALA